MYLAEAIVTCKECLCVRRRVIQECGAYGGYNGAHRVSSGNASLAMNILIHPVPLVHPTIP